MKKVLLSIALVFAISATSAIMAQEAEKPACAQQKTECVKKCTKPEEEKKSCQPEEKKCTKEAEKKCTKEAEKKCSAGKN